MFMQDFFVHFKNLLQLCSIRFLCGVQWESYLHFCSQYDLLQNGAPHSPENVHCLIYISISVDPTAERHSTVAEIFAHLFYQLLR